MKNVNYGFISISSVAYVCVGFNNGFTLLKAKFDIEGNKINRKEIGDTVLNAIKIYYETEGYELVEMRFVSEKFYNDYIETNNPSIKKIFSDSGDVFIEKCQ